MRITLRPTVAADLAHVFDRPIPHRIRALTAVNGEQVLGVGGIGYRPDGTVIAFAAITDEARGYPAAIHRAGLAAMRMIREAGVQAVLAEAEENNPAAERWLLRLGFRKIEIGGQPAFVWERDTNAP